MLSQQTQQLICRYQAWYQSLQPKKEEATIHVDEVASKVAAFYEKIKGVLDWREEHLLRKRGIERTLKRIIVFNGERNKEIAEPLVYELIRGGYFPNDTIPETKIKDVQKLLDKYFFILQHCDQRNGKLASVPPKRTTAGKEKSELQRWLIEIASYELERCLAPPLKEEALIDYMTALLKERIKVREGILVVKGITEEEKNLQIYIAVQKALFKLDTSIISFNILTKKYPDWQNLTPESTRLSEIAQNIYTLKENIEKALKHPLAEKFYRVCQKYNTPYLVLGDILADDPLKAEENLENSETLEELIKSAYSKRVIRLRRIMRRAAIYSTLSIFVTKIALALSVEIPFDKFIIGEFEPLALGINIFFPPFLMFLLVITVRPPKQENLQRVIMEITKIIYQTEQKDVYEIRVPPKRGKLVNSIIFTIYALTFIISFGIIIQILQKLNFSELSMAIFLVFLSMISFLGLKIRERGKEMLIEKEKETFLETIFDFFSLPIVRAGKWLSDRWAKIDIALILAIIIDMPFLTFVKFLEQWRYFLKEKKEEIH